MEAAAPAKEQHHPEQQHSPAAAVTATKSVTSNLGLLSTHLTQAQATI